MVITVLHNYGECFLQYFINQSYFAIGIHCRRKGLPNIYLKLRLGNKSTMESLPTPTKDFYFPNEQEQREHTHLADSVHSHIIDKNNSYVDHYIDQTGPTLFGRTRARNYVKKELTRMYSKDSSRVPKGVQTTTSPIKNSARITAATWERQNNKEQRDGGQWIFDPFIKREQTLVRLYPASRDDILLLTKSYDSMLIRWAKQLPKPPGEMLRVALNLSSVQNFLEVLQPELRMTQSIERELLHQITVVCFERGDLAGRLYRRYRRYVKGLIQLAKNIQLERARVQEFIPQVRENRKILMNAVDELESQARKAIETDELLDWSEFENLCKELANNGGDMELPTLRRLEKCIVALQTGRSEQQKLYILERKKLLDLKQKIDGERIKAIEQTKLMSKKLIALEHQDSVTSSIRENRIQLAVQDAYQRANSIAQTTIDRLEQDKARLNMAVLMSRKQMAQYKFENDKESWDFSVQCTPEIMLVEIAEAKLAAKSGKKGNKKDKKKGEDSNKKKRGRKKGKGEVANKELQRALKMIEDQKAKIIELEKINAEQDKRIEKLEASLAKKDGHSTHQTLPFENKTTDELKETADLVSEAYKKNDANTKAVKAETLNNDHNLQKQDTNQPTSRPETPLNMVDAETQYNEEDLKLNVKKKKKKVESKKRRPRRKKGGAVGKSADLAPIEPDPAADVQWASRWFSFILSQVCHPAPMGLQKKELFQNFARRVIMVRAGTQAFGDLILGHIALIAKEHSGNSSRMNNLQVLLGMKSFPRIDDGSIDIGEDTLASEWCLILCTLICQLHTGDDKPMLPYLESSAVPILHTIKIVKETMTRLQISKQAIDAVETELNANAEMSISNEVEYDTILDAVRREWLQQFGRRNMQNNARYNMATKEVNIFKTNEAIDMLYCQNSKQSKEVAFETYMKAINLIRKPSSIVSSKSNVTKNPQIDNRIFISAVLRAKWLLTDAEPRWLELPSGSLKSDEDDIFLISETWNAIKRKMTNIMAKCEDQGKLRKLAVRMRIELADAVHNATKPEDDEIIDEDIIHDDNERMWELLCEIGAVIVNQAKM
jgi:hypothetical protein